MTLKSMLYLFNSEITIVHEEKCGTFSTTYKDLNDIPDGYLKSEVLEIKVNKISGSLVVVVK